MVWVPLRFGGRAHFHAMEGWADLCEGGLYEGELCVRVYVCMRVRVYVCVRVARVFLTLCTYSGVARARRVFTGAGLGVGGGVLS